MTNPRIHLLFINLYHRILKIEPVDINSNSILGQIQSKSVNGLVTFDYITFVGKPGSQNALFMIIATNIDTQKIR